METPRDYTTAALENMIESMKYISAYENLSIIEESEFIIACMEAGMILLEADDAPKKAKSESLKQFVEIAKEFIEKIVAAFRKKAVEYADKYIPWVIEYQDEIIAHAETITNGFKITEYWKGNTKTSSAAVNAAVTQSANNTKPDYSFATKLLGNRADMIGDKDPNLKEYLKYYFRFGEIPNKLDADTVTLSGKELADVVSKHMIPYVLDYSKSIPSMVQKMQNTITKACDNMTAKMNQTVNESLTPDTYLVTECCRVCESVLTTLINYQSVMEAEPNGTDKPEPEKTTVDNGAKNEKGKELSANTVQREKTDEEVKKEEEKTGETGDTTKGDNPMTEYYKNVINFFKLAQSAWMTAAEERFLMYIKILTQIGDKDGKGPSFDKNGKYVRKGEPTEAKKPDAVEQETTETQEKK